MKVWKFSNLYFRNSVSNLSNIKRSVLIFFFLLISLLQLEAEGILQKPRKVYVVKTDHYEIFFSEKSMETANFLAENADALYEKAKESCGLQKDLSQFLVIISPDSDVLSVSYTQKPFNRITIFDSVPEENLTYYQDALLGLFYRETFIALSGAVKGPKQNFIFETVKKAVTPISLVNLPYSFIEGFAYLEEGMGSNSKYGRYNDGYFLQILSQAKMENKFPSYFQASVKYDIYPGEDLILAAGTGFAAYLIQQYGYEKYMELWQECGNIHFYFTAGIFYQVYGIPLHTLWAEFKDSVPLPEDMEYMEEMRKATTVLFEKNSESLYEQILLTPYGLLWYDNIKHEVDILDLNSKNQKIKLLFFADKIQRMCLSDDGRYVVISFDQIKTEQEFKRKTAWIYDLKKRSFYDYDFGLRDAAMIKMADGKNVIAGVAVRDKIAALEVYSVPQNEDGVEMIFQKKFQKNVIPSSLSYAGPGKVAYILSKNNEQKLAQLNLQTREEKTWEIRNADGDLINIRNLHFMNVNANVKNKTAAAENIYTFQFADNKKLSFTRMGCIALSEDFEPVSVGLQNKDLYGGVNYPVVYGDKIYYCSKEISSNWLCSINADLIDLTTLPVTLTASENNEYVPVELLFNKNTLGDNELSKYYPLKYMVPFSFIPFFAVRKISVEKGASTMPGLGFSIKTHSDPFMNNKLTLSGAWTFLKLDYSAAVNTSSFYNAKQTLEAYDWSKDKSVALFFENTSTPVDIKVGALFDFNMDGRYYFDAVAGTSWQIPKGMQFSHLAFDIHTNYSVSTEYHDANFIDSAEALTGWPAFNKAYQLFETSMSMQYSNIHQYGITPYEKLGVSFGPRFYYLMDDYLYKMIGQSYENVRYHRDPETDPRTDEEVDEDFNDIFLMANQFNVGWIGRFELPRITPFSMKNGWVLSMPTSISLEYLNLNGTLLNLKVESLLLGKEVHNGIPALLLYFTRVGLRAGYDFSLDYPTNQYNLPDVRNRKKILTLYESCYIHDYVYVELNVDFSSPFAALSAAAFSTNFKFSYFPRENGFIFNFTILANF